MPPPKPAPAPRKQQVTKAELKRRVNVVYKLLASAARREDILSNADKLGWGVNERQIDSYIKKAREQMAKDSEPERAELIAQADAELRNIQAAARTTGDHNNAIKARVARNKLLGLEAPRTINMLIIALGDLSPQLLIKVLEAIDARGWNKTEIFEAMLTEAAIMEPEGESNGQ